MRKNVIYTLFFVLLVVTMGAHIHGATIHVTTTEDKVAGSLRAAITTANANNEDDTIYLPAGIYILSGEANENENNGGDLDINSCGHCITIIGEKDKTTLIDGNENDRVLHILSGTLSISDVIIIGGRTTELNGGGIYNAGNLTLTDCIFYNNGIKQCEFPGDGGGIYNTGTQSLINCAIISNFIDGTLGDISPGGNGGGIYNKGIQTLENCTIEGNNAGAAEDVNLADDRPGGSGGGIYNSGTQSLTNCEITRNSAGLGHAFSMGGSGGGICNAGGETVLIGCTISHNVTGDTTDPAYGGNGGGISNIGTLTLTNCTVSNNITGNNYFYDRGGSGGGIFSTDTLTLTNCTINNNNASNGGNGGGICVDSGTAEIKNTIAANNQVGPQGEGPDCWGALNSGGYNLIENTSQCTINGTLTGNITGVDPVLGILADNGGATPTHALLPGSPAIDAGDSPGIMEDQRGYPRPVDMPGIPNVSDGADIGAYEFDTSHTISGTITSTGTGLPGVTLTFSNNGGTTTTDNEGNYSHTVSYSWSGTVTPSKEDYSFTPESKEYTNVTTDYLNQDYSAKPYSVSITITSPQPGAPVSGIVKISANASSKMNSTSAFIQSITTVEFYIDDTLVETLHSEPYEYLWDTTLYANGYHTVKVKAYNAANQAQESEIIVIVGNISHMSLNRIKLNFGADRSGIQTGSQEVLISNTGEGILEWTITDNVDWLICTPASGTQSGMLTASIDPSGLQPGTYTGTVTIEAPYTDNSPQTVAVTLTIYDGGSTQPPFGSFDTPIDRSTVMSSVPVTGWVLDDIQTEQVKIFREPLAGEGNNLIYIGEAMMVDGARTDIEIASPDYPLNYKAGWGYMMLTNFLPNQGNGTFTLHAMASDKEGNTVTLGTKTITCDNANAVKPFGALDTPPQGGAASGSAYTNFGWALTPLPNTIPFDGSTIRVWVDGVVLGNPAYNRYREDIATLFPGYNNSDGAVGLFYLDTTQYENGVHTIAWTVEDDAGNADGIGSRYFTIQNTGEARSRGHGAGNMEQGVSSHGAGNMGQGVWKTDPHSKILFDVSTPVQIKKGFKTNIAPQTIYPDNDGNITIEIKQLERVEIHLSELNSSSFIIHHSSFYPGYSGHLRVGGQLKPLPIGSTFDPENGIFYWMPGPACINNYEFIFIQKTGTGDIKKRYIIIVKINP